MTKILRRFAWLGASAIACRDDTMPADDTTSGTTAGASATTATTVPTTDSTSDADTTGGPATTTSGDLDTSSSTTGEPLPDAVAIYVASGSSILPFVIDLNSGALVAGSVVDTGATPGPMAHDLDRLFVGLNDDEAVATYQVASDGALSAIDTTPIAMNPVYLSIAEAGPYLLVADYGGDEVASFGVDGAGVVEAGAIVTLATGSRPHSIVLAPDQRFVFVPHLEDNVVVQLAFDPVLGVLSPHGATTGAPPDGAGPRHMVFASDASVAWVVNEGGDSITVWSYDAAMGQLAVQQTVGTLPDGVDGSDNYCGDIHVTPDGRFVYASNRGHDTIAMFAVQADGSLVATGHIATEPHVRDFAIEPGGRFLFAAGRDSGQLASYAIEPEGGLTAIGTTPVPPQPVWVEAVVLP